MWHEVIYSFDLLPEPGQVKSRLLEFLAGRDVPNIVESYYDGLSAGVTPEDAEASIMAESDALPLLIYCETRDTADDLVSLVRENFSPGLTPVIRLMPETASLNAWSDGDVFAAGQFEIRPAGQQGAATGDRKIISIVPGEAFGSGRHVTTIAMLRALSSLAVVRPAGTTRNFPAHVLDIGTGNGVLLIAASMLGARVVTGTDLTHEIIDEARKNLALNGVHARTLVTDQVPPGLPPQDLITANIPVAALRPLVPQMIAAAAPKALFLFAGFTTDDAAAFQLELALSGLSLLEATEERGWSALLLGQ